MIRRSFLRLCGGAGLLYPLRRALSSVQIPQTPLAGRNIPKYADPLPTFAGSRISGAAIDVSVEEFQQQILPASQYAGLPAPFRDGTYVWGYKVGDAAPLYPGVTIEAQRGTPTTVTYANNLPLPPFLQEYLTVDQTIHFADPLNQMGSRAPYAGPVPVVTHLHGCEVASSFDGGPDSWFTPGFAITGPGFVTNVSTYPNSQECTTLWFHDHALGMTRINVYAGLAGFYFLRDAYDTGIPGTGLNLPAGPYEIELAIQDRQFDTNGQWFFPDSAPGGLNGPPPNPDVHPYWIPEFFGDAMVVNGKTWPYLEVEPRRYRFRLLDGCNARFLQMWLANAHDNRPGPPIWQIGTDGGLLDNPVALTDHNDRHGHKLFLAPGERADIIIDFADFEGQTFTLLNRAAAPYPSGDAPDPQTNGQIMQFRVNQKLQGKDTSFDPRGSTLRGGTGQLPVIVRMADPSTGTVAAGVQIAARRQLTLKESEGPGGPLEVLVNNTLWDGIRQNTGTPIPGFVPDGRGDWLSELPSVGSTELWEIINLTEDAHPIHLHLVQFQLVNRQRFRAKYEDAWEAAFPGGAYIPGYGPPADYNTPNADGALGGNPAITPYLEGPWAPPEPGEAGWKDTVKAFPGQVTRIVVRWAPQDTALSDAGPGMNLYSFDPTTGPGYVWHCHIIDHEDNEMMRPYHPV
jgi:FtsP/CotA-like multicopper oxidase with cupredoxin domain